MYEIAALSECAEPKIKNECTKYAEKWELFDCLMLLEVGTCRC